MNTLSSIDEVTTPQSETPRMSFEKEPETMTSTRPRPLSEFDPCANAKITSPFYLYNHDSPRPSGDFKASPPIHITVKDLESGVTDTLTPVDTNASREKRGSKDSGKLKLWNRQKPKRCMTKKHQTKWKSLSVRQRFWIKIAVFLLLVGMVVGIAVGVSIAVHGGVLTSNGNGNSNIQ